MMLQMDMRSRRRLPAKSYVYVEEPIRTQESFDVAFIAYQVASSVDPSPAPVLRDGRADIWRRMYGLKPMPKPQIGVAMKYAGLIGRDLNITQEDVDAAFEEIDSE